MLIIDAHLDLAWNALQWNRDLLNSAYTIRTQENWAAGKGWAQGTVALPEMRQGRIALSFATMLVRSTGQPVKNLDFRSAAQAYGIALGQLAYYRALECEGHVRIITNLAELNRHMAEWEAWDVEHKTVSSDTPPPGFVISMESADSILSPEQLP